MFAWLTNRQSQICEIQIENVSAGGGRGRNCASQFRVLQKPSWSEVRRMCVCVWVWDMCFQLYCLGCVLAGLKLCSRCIKQTRFSHCAQIDGALLLVWPWLQPRSLVMIWGWGIFRGFSSFLLFSFLLYLSVLILHLLRVRLGLDRSCVSPAGANDVKQ